METDKIIATLLALLTCVVGWTASELHAEVKETRKIAIIMDKRLTLLERDVEGLLK